MAHNGRRLTPAQHPNNINKRLKFGHDHVEAIFDGLMPKNQETPYSIGIFIDLYQDLVENLITVCSCD